MAGSQMKVLSPGRCDQSGALAPFILDVLSRAPTQQWYLS